MLNVIKVYLYGILFKLHAAIADRHRVLADKNSDKAERYYEKAISIVSLYRKEES